jgi:predicted flavoprotein YhiN
MLLDLFPELSFDELLTLYVNRCKTLSSYPLSFFFTGMINKKLTPVLLRLCASFCSTDMSGSRLIGSMSNEELHMLADICKNWRIEVVGTLNYDHAQITLGGLSIEDFHIPTLESKLVPGLYAAGEILDMTGDCGGYNLQWAWSSGYLAGISAAKKI